MADNWVSPTGHTPNANWDNESYAYDEDTDSKASTQVEGDYLELTHSAINCDKIRIYTAIYILGDYYDPDIDIDVYYGEAWHNIFSGTVTKNEWIEKAIGSTESVTATRVKCNDVSGNRYFRLYEFDFNGLLTVETDACSNPTPSSLQTNGDLISEGFATVFRRGFQYFKGDAGDPPDLIRVLNPSFEAGSPPDDWTLGGSGAACERSIEQVKLGSYSVKVTRSGFNCYVYQDIPSYADYAGEDVTLGVWVYASTGGQARLQLNDGIATSVSDYHSGTPGWEWLTVTHTMNASPTRMRLILYVRNEDGSAYFDGAILVHDDEILAVYEDGSFSEGEYNDTIEGLDAGSDYRVRAFAQNADGIAYGNVVTCGTITVGRRGSFFKMF